jgi:hypothetical protein
MGRKIKSKEKRSGLKPPFKELSHGNYPRENNKIHCRGF